MSKTAEPLPLYERPPFNLDADPPPRFVIGIDTGTACGWGVLRTDGRRVLSGEWDLSIRKGEGSGMPFVRLRGYLASLHEAFPDAVWAYELVERHVRMINGKPQVNTYAAQTYGKLVGTLLGYLEGEGVSRYVGVPVATVKRTATGKGNAKKEAMIAAAKRRWESGSDAFRSDVKSIEDDNEADALWVAETARKLLPEAWTQ